MGKPAEEGNHGKGSLPEDHVDVFPSRERYNAGNGALSRTCEPTSISSKEVPVGGNLKAAHREEPSAVAVRLRSDTSNVRQEGGEEAEEIAGHGTHVEALAKDREDLKGALQEVESTQKPDPSLSKAKPGFPGLDASAAGVGKAEADGDGIVKAMNSGLLGRIKKERQESDRAGPTRLEVSAATDAARPARLQNFGSVRRIAQFKQPPSARQSCVAPQACEVREVI